MQLLDCVRRDPRRYIILVSCLAVAALGLSLFAILADNLRRGVLQPADDVLLHLVRPHESAVLYYISIVLNYALLFPWVLLLILPFAVFLLKTKRVRVFWAYTLTLTGTLVIISVLKAIIARPRPLQALLFERSYSFPSGHATSAVVIYGILGYFAWRYLVKKPLGRVLVAAAAVSLVVATGCSRVYLGVHYASDVIAGWAMGVFILFAAVSILEFVRRGRV